MKNKTEKLWQQLRRIEQLIGAPDLEGAKRLLVEVEASTALLGIESSHLMWLRSIVEDNSGEYEAALRSIQVAIAMDPVAPPYRHSLQVIVNHVRAALNDATRSGTFTNMPGLWGLLVQAGEADDRVHLALAHHHVSVGANQDALRILRALTTLSPGNIEAWTMLMNVAADLDLAELASQARIEASALGATPVAFVMPAEAEG